jgi:hypothetical protein
MVGEAGRALLAHAGVRPASGSPRMRRAADQCVTTNATDAGLLAGLLQHFSKT